MGYDYLINRAESCLTKGTKELVEVTSLPFFWKGDIQDMVSFRLHYGNRGDEMEKPGE